MAVQISGNDITVPRDGTFTRNVTIGGTLTYEDVTNIDSVGLVTARTGIEIGARPGVAASISVDGNMIVSGISTFGGDVQVPDKIIHSGDTDTAIRFSGADTITAETGGSSRFKIDSSGNVTIGNDGDSGSNPSSGYDELCIEGGNEAIGMCFLSPAANDVEQTIAFGDSNNNQSGKIQYEHANDAMHFDTAGSERLRIDSSGNITAVNTASGGQSVTLKIGASNSSGVNDGIILINNGGTGNGVIQWDYESNANRAQIFVYRSEQELRFTTAGTERLRIASDGDVTLQTGDLVIGTSGKGIDFSANTSDSAGVVSEVLDDYEEGTFTPNIQGTGSNNSKTYSYQLGKYTKIGNIVHCEFRITWSGYSGNDTGSAIVNGFPFVIDNNIATGAIVGALATNNCNYPGSNTVATAGWEASNGQQYVFPLVSYDNSSWQNPDANSFWGGSANVRGSVTYRVN